jgi:hypothetical protein
MGGRTPSRLIWQSTAGQVRPPEQRNGQLANKYREETKHRNLTPQQIISDQEWSIWIADRKITGDTLNTVRRHIQETEMSKWVAAHRKNGREPRLSLTRQQLINTKAITDSWKEILHGQRKWLTKMSQRFAPVGKNMNRWGFWTNSRCPACHRDNEDEDHLFKCSDQQCKDTRTEATRVLQQRLQRCKTEPLLPDMILQKVQQYTGLVPRTELEIDDNDIRALQFTVRVLLAGTISFSDKQPDSLRQYSKSILPPHDNGIVLLSGPRISHWHYGTLVGNNLETSKSDTP